MLLINNVNNTYMYILLSVFSESFSSNPPFCKYHHYHSNSARQSGLQTVPLLWKSQPEWRPQWAPPHTSHSQILSQAMAGKRSLEKKIQKHWVHFKLHVCIKSQKYCMYVHASEHRAMKQCSQHVLYSIWVQCTCTCTYISTSIIQVHVQSCKYHYLVVCNEWWVNQASQQEVEHNNESLSHHEENTAPCVCACVCVCICSLLLGNPNFKDPYLIAQVVYM